MTDDLLGKNMDVLAEAHAWMMANCSEDGHQCTPAGHLIRDLKSYAVRLIVALRETRAELAIARSVTRRLLDGWHAYVPISDDKEATWGNHRLEWRSQVITDAERAWLASVGSAPTTTED